MTISPEKQQALLRLQKLQQAINALRFQYHIVNNPSVTDDVYESLMREVKDIETQFPDIAISDQFNRVAGQALDGFEKVSHKRRMLSLNDAFSIDELQVWSARMEKLIATDDIQSPLHYFAEVKLDGLAVSLRYENGVLVQAATRGDGMVGENITENAKMVATIPLRLLAPFPAVVEIRGEIIMQKSVLERLNKEHVQQGKTPFANTRNAAAGSVRQLDPSVVKSRDLDFFGYDLFLEEDSDVVVKNHSDKHALLRSFGVPTVEHEIQTTTIAALVPFIEKVGTVRDSLPYHIDGIVIAIDELALQESLGVVGKAPRYAVAYKYPAERVATIVTDITVQVGRTGVLTPLAHVVPTSVAGSTVSKATLHNIDQIRRLDIRVGDTVVLQKAGDVIPEIVQVLTELRTGKETVYDMPAYCPVCGAAVTTRTAQDEGQTVAYFCTNEACPARQTRGLIHAVHMLDIYEIGPKVIDRLQEEGLISDLADLFALTEADLSGLERFGVKSAQNIITAIADKKQPPLDRYIAALGIMHVGEQTARDLALHFGSFETFWHASDEDMITIANIGPTVVESIAQYKNNPAAVLLQKKLADNGVVPQAMKQQSVAKGTENPFAQATVVITGTLETMSREEIKKLVQDNGGKVASSVSAKTSMVIVGEAPGSKYADAVRLGVRIVEEEAFLKMVKGLL